MESENKYLSSLHKLLGFDQEIKSLKSEYLVKVNNINILFDRKISKLESKEVLVDSYFDKYCDNSMNINELNNENISYKEIVQNFKKLNQLYKFIEEEINTKEISYYKEDNLKNDSKDLETIINYLIVNNITLINESFELEEKKKEILKEKKENCLRINRMDIVKRNSIEAIEKKIINVVENFDSFNEKISSINIEKYDFQKYINGYEKLFSNANNKWNSGKSISFDLYDVYEQNSNTAILAIDKFNKYINNIFIPTQRSIKILTNENDGINNKILANIENLKSIAHSMDNMLNIHQVKLEQYKKMLDFYSNKARLLKSINDYRFNNLNRIVTWEQDVKNNDFKNITDKATLLLVNIKEIINKKKFENKEKLIDECTEICSEFEFIRNKLNNLELNFKPYLAKLNSFKVLDDNLQLDRDSSNITMFIKEWIISEIIKVNSLINEISLKKQECSKYEKDLYDIQGEIEVEYSKFLSEIQAKRKKQQALITMILGGIIVLIFIWLIVRFTKI